VCVCLCFLWQYVDMLCGYLIFLITVISSSCPKNWIQRPNGSFLGGGGEEKSESEDYWVSIFQKPHRIHSFHRKNLQRKNRIRKVIDFLNFSKK
jgi:hypothetical protein